MEKHGQYRALVAALLLATPAHADCGVALVLAIDVSGSVSPAEFDLQMLGTADALRDPQVAEALLAEQAALALIEWTGQNKQELVVPWTSITDEAALERFAGSVAGAPRVWQHFSTAVGSALGFAGDSFADAPDCQRRVIDVSGDGSANEGPDAAQARDALVAQGFIINAVAIEGAEPDLTAWFKQNVIGGTGAFVLTAKDYDDYPRAIRRKLINEVTKPGS